MICIIPARGGSKRLPGKNIVDFFGMPIIYHVIKAARDSGIFDHIVVSTDDGEIADIVYQFGCTYHIRSEMLSGDVPESEVLFECANAYQDAEICRIYPFAALLTPERINKGYEVYENETCDAVMECQQYRHPPQRVFTLAGQKGCYMFPHNIMKRTQDLSAGYHDAGTFMFTDIVSVRKPLTDMDIRWIEVTELEAQDVDTAEDLEMARLKYLRIVK